MKFFSYTLAGLLVASCGAKKPKPQAPPITADSAPDTHLLRTMGVIASGVVPKQETLEALSKRLASGELTMDAHIESLVTSERFDSRVAPFILMRHFLSQEALDAPAKHILNKTEGPNPIYYRYNACTEKDTVKVRPWWDLDSEIRVCKDSHLPEKWQADVPKGQADLYCLSSLSSYFSYGERCGCGPNLVRCFNGEEHRQEHVDSIHGELSGSVSYVSSNDLPIETLFTANETFRDRGAEFVRLGQEIEMRQDTNPEGLLRKVAEWPKEGKWAARPDLAPGQHAGLLTSPTIVGLLPDRRQRMTFLYEMLWCQEADSVGATPDNVNAVVKSPDLQLQNDGWKDLASRPICTNCHARLDYGQQFFMGFTNGYLRAFFVAEEQLTGSGGFYAAHINDLRGQGELNPQGFAKLAVQQPEFGTCMAKNFAEYVLGPRASNLDTEEIAKTFVVGKTTIRGLMRSALRMLVARSSAEAPDESRQGTEQAAVAGLVQVSDQLAESIEERCGDCHTDAAPLPDFSGSQLSTSTVVAMLDEIAFERMPKGVTLTEEVRTDLVRSLIDATWAGDDAALAHTYFAGRWISAQVHRPELLMDSIHRSVGGKGERLWRMVENFHSAKVQQLTPGYAVISGVVAIEACANKHADSSAARQACIDEAIRLDYMTPDAP